MVGFVEAREITREQQETTTKTNKPRRRASWRNRLLRMSRIELRSNASSIALWANRCCKRLRLGCSFTRAAGTTETAEAHEEGRNRQLLRYGVDQISSRLNHIYSRALYIFSSKCDDHETSTLGRTHNLVG